MQNLILQIASAYITINLLKKKRTNIIRELQWQQYQIHY